MKIAFTCGDVNGIGLEVLFKAFNRLSDTKYSELIEPVLYVNKKSLSEYLRYSELNNKLIYNYIQTGKFAVQINECRIYCPVEFGRETKSAGALASESIFKALADYKENNYSAIVTMPISKNSLMLAGEKDTSHTDILKSYFKNSKPFMLFYYKKMITALATIHVPLIKVSSIITKDYLEERIDSLDIILKNDFNINNPRIAVLSLNPHSGENGLMGKDEVEKIIPAIQACRLKGIKLQGPFPSDGFYAFGDYKKYDAVLAMYHDQGLIPMKLLTKGNAVNITANIPIVRTSPDHGTAFSIAGKNLASEESTIQAIKIAFKIAKNRIRK